MLLLAAVGTLATDSIPSSCNWHRNLIYVLGDEGKGITSCTPQVIVNTTCHCGIVSLILHFQKFKFNSDV